LVITEVKTHLIPLSSSWISESLIASPMSIFEEYREKRSTWFGPLTTALIEVKTDSGLQGWGMVGGGKGKLAVPIIEDQFKQLLVGHSPFDTELLWEQMFRASQFYGRRGIVIEVMSGIDLALWDVVGKATGQPVYNLLGGKTKDRIPVYLTGSLTRERMAAGFQHAKLPVRHGPADGLAGLRKNVEMVEEARTMMGPDGDLMLDCYMGLDVPYAVALAMAVADFRVPWMEEPVPPDQPDAYRRIKDAVPEMLITGGEHEYTRYGFRNLIEKQAVDILQPDIYRAGGMTELKKIAAMASAYGLPVIPHGVGAPTYHFVMVTLNCPRAEYVDVLAQGRRTLFRGDPQPSGGYVELGSAPGFGYEPDEEVLQGKAPAALIR